MLMPDFSAEAAETGGQRQRKETKRHVSIVWVGTSREETNERQIGGSFSGHVMALLAPRRSLGAVQKFHLRWITTTTGPGLALFTEWPPNPFAAVHEGLSINPHFHSPPPTERDRSEKRSTKGWKDVAAWILSSFRLHNLQLKVYWPPFPFPLSLYVTFSLSWSILHLLEVLSAPEFLLRVRATRLPSSHVICIMQ